MEKLDNKTGFIKNNPLFILFLGLTTGLAITTNLTNALGMSVIVLIVSLLGSLLVGIFKKFVPYEAVLIVSLVINVVFIKIIGLLVSAYMPSLGGSLGVQITLLTVNTLILYSVGAFDKKENKEIKIKGALLNSVFYSFALILISLVREILGAGTLSLINPLSGETIFNLSIVPSDFVLGMFLKPEGGFLVVGVLAAIFAALNFKKDVNKEVK